MPKTDNNTSAAKNPVSPRKNDRQANENELRRSMGQERRETRFPLLLRRAE